MANKIINTELHIRFSEKNFSDLIIPVDSNDDLLKINNGFLRKLVRDHDPQLHKKTFNKRLKFIYNGRPITDSTNFQESLSKFTRLVGLEESDDDDDDDEEESTTLLSKSKGKENLPPTVKDPRIKVHKIFIHCLIGDALSPEELQQEDQLDSKHQLPSTTPAPIGFDRLLNAGFSETEVAELRQQFQSIYGSTLNLNIANDLDDEFDDDENDDEEEEEEEEDKVEQEQEEQGTNENIDGTTGTSVAHLQQQMGETDIRQLEERWIESSANDPSGLTTVNSRGLFGLGLAEQGDTNNRDLLVGVLIGAIFGILSLLLLKEEFRIFNKRTRMAMVAGVLINFSFAIVKQWS